MKIAVECGWVNGDASFLLAVLSTAFPYKRCDSFSLSMGTCQIQVYFCCLVLCDHTGSDPAGAALCKRFPFVIRNTFSSQTMVYLSQWLSAMWSWVKLALGWHEGVRPDLWSTRVQLFGSVDGLDFEHKENRASFFILVIDVVSHTDLNKSTNTST